MAVNVAFPDTGLPEASLFTATHLRVHLSGGAVVSITCRVLPPAPDEVPHVSSTTNPSPTFEDDAE